MRHRICDCSAVRIIGIGMLRGISSEKMLQCRKVEKLPNSLPKMPKVITQRGWI